MRKPLLLSSIAAGAALLAACGQVAGMGPMFSDLVTLSVNLDVRDEAGRHLLGSGDTAARQYKAEDIDRVTMEVRDLSTSTSDVVASGAATISGVDGLRRPLSLGNLRRQHSYSLQLRAYDDTELISVDADSIATFAIGDLAVKNIDAKLKLKKTVFSGTAQDPNGLENGSGALNVPDGGWEDTTATETVKFGS